MASNDLSKWVTSDVDFYALLGLPSSTFTESELRRAYRKTSLKYHPDKLGKDFDPEKYELFQSAFGVLESEELRAKYDGHRQAKLQRQRANELFEGKRRAMKEDLEARERGGGLSTKRSREEEEGAQEMRRLAEEGRKRRAEREKMMGTNSRVSSPVPAAPQGHFESQPPPQAQGTSDPAQTPEDEDEVAVLERRIREAEAAKAQRKADKRARKSGVFTPAPESPVVPNGAKEAGASVADRLGAMTTPLKRPRPDLFKGLKADEKSSASPRFSFSPSVPTPKRKDFTATMERLKAAEKSRMEDEIRREEAGEESVLR